MTEMPRGGAAGIVGVGGAVPGKLRPQVLGTCYAVAGEARMNTKTVLSVWVSDLTFPGYIDRWHKLAAEFERVHPEYRVAIKGIGFFTGPTEIAEAIARGSAPTIAEYIFYMTQTARDTRAADGGPQYVSIEKAIDGRSEILGEEVVIADLIPAMRDWYTCGGELACMPSVGTTNVLYANTDLLERAGLSQMPRTWAEVEAACEAIRSLGGAHQGITWANSGLFYLQALASQGGLLADNDNGRSGRATTVDLASAEMLSWAGWWQRLHGNGDYLYPGKIPGWEGTFRAFAERAVALRLSSSNDVNYMVQAAKSGGFRVEASAYPYNSTLPYAGNAIAGSSLWLAGRLDRKTEDGALAFLQFIHNPRNAADRHQANSFVPLTQAAFDLLEAEGWFAEHPYHRVASDQLRTYPDRPRGEGVAGQSSWPAAKGVMIGDFAGIQDVLTHAMEDVLVRGADLAGCFGEATATAQRLLDAYNAECMTTGPRSPSSLRVEFFTDSEPYSGADLENVVRLQR
jgi:sn-glycerol 3-phosphate transport system substrate-binding protein